jgi:hypothetical protein
MTAARMAAPTTAIGTAIATLVVVLRPPPPPPSSLSAEAMEVLDGVESEVKLVVDAEVYIDVSVAWVVDADGLSSAVIVVASVAVASAHSEMELIGLDCPFTSG